MSGISPVQRVRDQPGRTKKETDLMKKLYDAVIHVDADTHTHDHKKFGEDFGTVLRLVNDVTAQNNVVADAPLEWTAQPLPPPSGHRYRQKSGSQHGAGHVWFIGDPLPIPGWHQLPNPCRRRPSPVGQRTA